MSKEQEFWNWFEENEAKFFFLNQIDDENEKERLLDYFLERLHDYCDKLYFLIGGRPDEIQELIITAEGDTSLFEKVEELVKHAPSLPHWKVIAFKPAREEDFTTVYADVKLDPKMMYFIPLHSENSEKLGLRVYIDDYEQTDTDDFLTATYIVLDTILGEKSSALDIGYVELENLPPGAEREELIELSKLPRYVAWKKSKVK